MPATAAYYSETRTGACAPIRRDREIRKISKDAVDTKTPELVELDLHVPSVGCRQEVLLFPNRPDVHQQSGSMCAIHHVCRFSERAVRMDWHEQLLLRPDAVRIARDVAQTRVADQLRIADQLNQPDACCLPQVPQVRGLERLDEDRRARDCSIRACRATPAPCPRAGGRLTGNTSDASSRDRRQPLVPDVGFRAGPGRSPRRTSGIWNWPS